MNGQQAAKEQLHALLEMFNSPGNFGTICVSHDQNLLILNNYYFGLSPITFPNIDYMDGIILFQKDDIIYMTRKYQDQILNIELKQDQINQNNK